MPKPAPQPLTEKALGTALRLGKPEALSCLYDKYAPVLTGLATRIMGNKECAEAVLQDTFVAIWERKATYDATRLSVLSWIILITRDMAMGALKSGKYNRLLLAEESFAHSASTPDTDTTGTVEIMVKTSFCNLQADERAALDLVYLKGYLCTEAAAELGISTETLRERLKMAGKHLREGGVK